MHRLHALPWMNKKKKQMHLNELHLPKELQLSLSLNLQGETVLTVECYRKRSIMET